MNVSVGHCPIIIIITLIAIMMTSCLSKTVKHRGSVGQCPGLVLDQSLRVSFMFLSIFICCNVSIASSSSSQSSSICYHHHHNRWVFLEFIYKEIKWCWSQVPGEFDLLLVQLHQGYLCPFLPDYKVKSASFLYCTTNIPVFVFAWL